MDIKMFKVFNQGQQENKKVQTNDEAMTLRDILRSDFKQLTKKIFSINSDSEDQNLSQRFVSILTKKFGNDNTEYLIQIVDISKSIMYDQM